MTKPIILFPICALLLVAPFLGLPSHLLNLLIYMMIIALAAQGWNLLGGYGGLSSFGHAAFFGTGAYATALLQTSLGINAYLAVMIGILIGGFVGVAIGYLSFRSGLRGSYFALVTLAFAEVFRVLANAASFTGGAAGVLVPLTNDMGDMQFTDRRLFALLLAAAVAAVMIGTWAMERTRFGSYLVSIRENEDAARALGVNPLRVKLIAIWLSAATTAAAGGFYTQNFLYLDANIAYGAWISIEALFAAIVGGMGTVIGPVLGAIALLSVGEVTKMVSGGVVGLDLVAFGVVLIICVAFARDGLVGLIRRIAARKAVSGGK